MAHGPNDPGRRRFIGGLTLAGAAGWLGHVTDLASAEPPPETTSLRVAQLVGVCVAPQYVTEELFQAEGFRDVRYVQETEAFGTGQLLVEGKVDISLGFAAPLAMRLDARDPVMVLAGIHSGCFELFGSPRVPAVRDLKSKPVATNALGSTQQIFISTIAAHVGLDPRTDIQWVVIPGPEQGQRLAEGRVDAMLGFPPIAQELRERKIGRVVLNSTTDRPWSQYFCCMAAASRDFVRTRPVATKRALRALLKAADLCALEPERVARVLTERGYVKRYDQALEIMREVPYNRWRTYDPEDTLRFYALRLHEAGMVKSSPQRIIAQGADWRFLNELRRELKG